MKNNLKQLVFSIICFTLLSACATSAPVAKKRFFWPRPPDEPKIEWLATYYVESDLGGQSALISNVIGDQSAIGFTRPLYVGGNSVDKVVVSDTGLNGFVVMDLKKKTFTMLGGASMLGALTFPTGAAFDGNGYIYAADGESRKIYVVDNKNIVLKVLDLSEEIQSIGSFAIDKKRGHIIIPDAKKHMVAIFSLEGKLLQSIGKFGEKDGEFNYPVGIALDKQDNIYVSDSFNARIQIFSPEGIFKSKFGKRGDAIGDFGIIKSLALDSEGHIYVVDARYHRIQIFNASGQILLSVGGEYSQMAGEPIRPGGLLLPHGIYIDELDRIYVADLLNKRIQVFQYMNQNEIKKLNKENL